MEVLGDVVARDRRCEAPALRHALSGRAYDYRRFCTTAWKVGNFLRNEGVRAGMDVAVAAGPVPESVLGLYGAALLGAAVEFGPGALHEETRALLAPTASLDEYDVGPRTRVVAYGAEPDDPAVAFFERDVWSENPTRPPDVVTSDRPLLRADGDAYAHATVLGGARRVVDEYALDRGTTVAVRAPLAHPGTVAAGLVAPILAGGEILFPGESAEGDLSVGEGPEETVIVPERVLA